MNSIYSSVVIKEIKSGLIIAAVTICFLIAVLFLQSKKFASSFSVLLEVGYLEWGEQLLGMLESLVVWAIVTGLIFSISFFIHSPANDLKKMLSGVAVGFITGFAFTYILVLTTGIVIYIPLGITSIFLTNIVRFATLHFAWLVSAYVIFILIAVDTPKMLFYIIKRGNWYFKLLGILMALLLGVQIIKATAGVLLLILKYCIWQTNTALVALGVSLLITIVINTILLKGEAITKIIFAIIAVYIAATITGNVSYGELHWGEIPSFILASFIGPITYSFGAKAIIKNGINAISGILGFVGGIVAGLLIDQLTGLRIIGQGWFGILCGTLITVLFGVGFGLLWGPAISKLLIKAKIKPEVSFYLGFGLLLGIVVGMVSGGLIAR